METNGTVALQSKTDVETCYLPVLVTCSIHRLVCIVQVDTRILPKPTLKEIMLLQIIFLLDNDLKHISRLGRYMTRGHNST